MNDPRDSFEYDQPFRKYGVDDHTVITAGRAVAALRVIHTVPDKKRLQMMQKTSHPSIAQRMLLGSNYLLDVSTKISNWKSNDNEWAERLYGTSVDARYSLGALAAAAAVEVPVDSEVTHFTELIAAAAQDTVRDPDGPSVASLTPESVRKLLGSFVRRRSPQVIAGYAKEFFSRDTIDSQAVTVLPSDVPLDLATATPWMRSMVNAAVSTARPSRYTEYAFSDGCDHVLAYVGLAIGGAPHI